jgi:hypothetical protein
LVRRDRRARGVQLSLQFRRKFADKVFNPFRFVPMTNQKGI